MMKEETIIFSRGNKKSPNNLKIFKLPSLNCDYDCSDILLKSVFLK